MTSEYGFTWKELAAMDPTYLRGVIDERRGLHPPYPSRHKRGGSRPMTQREAENTIRRAKTEAA